LKVVIKQNSNSELIYKPTLEFRTQPSLWVLKKSYLSAATVNATDTCTVTIVKLKSTLIFTKHPIVLIEVSPLRKYFTVEFIRIDVCVVQDKRNEENISFPSKSSGKRLLH